MTTNNHLKVVGYQTYPTIQRFKSDSENLTLVDENHATLFSMNKKSMHA
jgi:hypothetical protein